MCPVSENATFRLWGNRIPCLGRSAFATLDYAGNVWFDAHSTRALNHSYHRTFCGMAWWLMGWLRRLKRETWKFSFMRDATYCVTSLWTRWNMVWKGKAFWTTSLPTVLETLQWLAHAGRNYAFMDRHIYWKSYKSGVRNLSTASVEKRRPSPFLCVLCTHVAKFLISAEFSLYFRNSRNGNPKKREENFYIYFYSSQIWELRTINNRSFGKEPFFICLCLFWLNAVPSSRN